EDGIRDFHVTGVQTCALPIFDGREVQVPKGTGLVEAAAAAGVEIPVFCHHPKLDPVGVCRMCLVEVEGQRKPVPACTTRAADGKIGRASWREGGSSRVGDVPL